MSGRDEYSFVEVVMQTYEPGEVAWSDYLNSGWVLFEGHFVDFTEDVEEVRQAKAENAGSKMIAESAGKSTYSVNSKAFEADLLVTQPFTVWQFNCFGQGFTEGTASGIEHEMQQMDAEYVFKAYLEELKKIGQQLIQEDYIHWNPARGKQPDYKTVRFVTLWSYRSWEDSYNHEWDSEWTLEGLVDPKRLMQPGINPIRFKQGK